MNNTKGKLKKTQADQLEDRKKLVGMVKSKVKPLQIAEALGLNPKVVYKLRSEFNKKGEKAFLTMKKRGSHKPKKLTKAQENAIQKAITDKHPEQLKLPFVLWTREAVASLIKQRYNKVISLPCVSLYLKKWGFTPQKPLYKAYQQQPDAVKEWLESIYPTVEAEAREAKATIHWVDESGLQANHNAGKSYAPRGKRPVVRSTWARIGLNYIASVTNKGSLSFSIYTTTFTAEVFIKFLERLLKKEKGKPLVVIVDGHPVHKSRAVKDWLDKKNGLLKLVYLPAYSPELNPEEVLNSQVKSTVFKSKRPSKKAEIIDLTSRKLKSLQKQPAKVLACFQSPTTSYAAFKPIL